MIFRSHRASWITSPVPGIIACLLPQHPGLSGSLILKFPPAWIWAHVGRGSHHRLLSPRPFLPPVADPSLQWGSTEAEHPNALSDVAFWAAERHDAGTPKPRACVRSCHRLSVRRFWRTDVYRRVHQAECTYTYLDSSLPWMSPWAKLLSLVLNMFTAALPGRVPRVSRYMPCLILRTNPRDRYCDFYFMDPNTGASHV